MQIQAIQSYRDMDREINIYWVDRVKDTEFVVQQIQETNIVGIDMEFNSRFTYEPDISLMQLSVDFGDEVRVYLVDIQKIKLTDDLRQMLVDPTICKVFQDMKYDFNLLWYEYDCIPRNVFDVSIIDKLIRRHFQNRSLDKIEDEYLGASNNPSKSIQKSNWGVRPLSQKQLDYAAEDVLNLPLIKHKMEERIAGDFRYACYNEYMNNFQPDLEEKFYNRNYMWKIKGSRALDQDALRRLDALLVELDIYAKKVNKPPHFLAPNQVIFSIAKKNPGSKYEFEKLFLGRGKLRTIRKKAVDPLFNAMKQANASREQFHPPPVGTSLKRLIPEYSERSYHPSRYIQEILNQWRASLYERIYIPHEFIIPKKDIPFLSSLSDEEIVVQMQLPGIIPALKDYIRLDFQDYMRDDIPDLDYKFLQKEYEKLLKNKDDKR